MKKTNKTENEQQYPGAGFTDSKNAKENACLGKQYTKELNNNPRNEGQII